MNWFKTHWSTAVTLGCVLISAFIEAWQQATNDLPSKASLPRLQDGWHYVPLILLITAGVVWLIGRKTRKQASEDGARKSARLKIISANYGADGMADPDVTHYLLEKARDNYLAESVGADFFHGFDPLAGWPKRLKVRYSFDGKEAMIERPENSWLILPEDPLLKSQIDDLRRQLKFNENQYNSALSELRENLKESASRNLEYRGQLAMFTPLQLEAIHLADELTEFLKELGLPPSPKYTEDEIIRMPDSQRKKLNDENDGEYIEACEYHFGKGSMRLNGDGLSKQLVAHNLRMWPWYDKVQANYDERFASKVQSLQRRFVIADIPADALSVVIGGPDGTKNIRTIASKLWELAFKIKEKELPNDQDQRLSEGR